MQFPKVGCWPPTSAAQGTAAAEFVQNVAFLLYKTSRRSSGRGREYAVSTLVAFSGGRASQVATPPSRGSGGWQPSLRRGLGFKFGV